MEPYIVGLEGRIVADRMRLVAMTAELALRAGLYDWLHRDPFDRLIAATAQVMGLVLVSGDASLDSVPGGLTRVW